MTESKWTDSTDDVIEFAHVLIANAMNVGNPPEDPVPGWHDAAREWIDRHGRWLANRLSQEDPWADCPSNITEHDPVFASTPCILKGAHPTHKGANGETWTNPPPTAPAKEWP